jgi:hypothetical protein
MTFKSTIETLSEAELDGVAGGAIRQLGPGASPGTSSGAGIDNFPHWAQYPIYLCGASSGPGSIPC